MKHLFKLSLVFVLLPLLVGLVMMPHASAADLGNIWPLGDSITYGAGHVGGYRDTLFTNLTARGYSFKFVGTLTSNPTKELSEAGQDHHDGHSGWAIANAVDIDGKPRRGLYQGLETWHRSIKKPDVILLMIGINDLNTGYKIDAAPERLDLLVSRLFSYYPHTRILLASLPDADSKNHHRHGATNDLTISVREYNSWIASLVAKRKALGQNITVVDMHSHFTLADLRDGLHPNPQGYVKMGDIWANAVVASAKSGPQAEGTEIKSAVETASNPPVRLVIIGDSTVCNYPAKSDRFGWGMFIQEYFQTNTVMVINRAKGDYSSKSFINGGWWQKALAQKPDYVLIQFGHNDMHPSDRPESTDANTDFKDYLRRYADDSRASGAIPVFITPMEQRDFDTNGVLHDALQSYANAMKAVGAEKQVPVIDLHASSKALVEKLGPEKSGEMANRIGDKTHFNVEGAKTMAALVMEDLPTAAPGLKKYLKTPESKNH